MKINPKNIISRHKEFPEATESLIREYGYLQYKKALSDFAHHSQITNINESGIVAIFVNKDIFDDWKNGKNSEAFMNRNS